MANDVPAKREKTAYERLKRRHQRFVDAYVPGGTGADAAKAMGYKGKRPQVVAWKFLHRPYVVQAIEEQTKLYLANAGVRHERIMRELYSIATADPRKLVHPDTGAALPLKDLPPDVAATISSVEVEEISTGGLEGTRYKYRFWDKNKALDKLGQYLKLWDAKGPTVNVDARSVTINNDAGAGEALRAVAELGSRIAGALASQSAPAADQNGPVLLAAVRDEPQGRGAPVDAGADTRGPREP